MADLRGKFFTTSAGTEFGLLKHWKSPIALLAGQDCVEFSVVYSGWNSGTTVNGNFPTVSGISIVTNSLQESWDFTALNHTLDDIVCADRTPVYLGYVTYSFSLSWSAGIFAPQTGSYSASVQWKAYSTIIKTETPETGMSDVWPELFLDIDSYSSTGSAGPTSSPYFFDLNNDYTYFPKVCRVQGVTGTPPAPRSALQQYGTYDFTNKCTAFTTAGPVMMGFYIPTGTVQWIIN